MHDEYNQTCTMFHPDICDICEPQVIWNDGSIRARRVRLGVTIDIYDWRPRDYLSPSHWKLGSVQPEDVLKLVQESLKILL